MRLDGSCHCGARAVSRRIAHAVSFHALLLLDLPQDAGRRRLRDQHHGRRVHARASAAEVGERLSRPHREPGDTRKRLSPARRHFCRRCSSALWVSDPRWAQWVYPFASAIDTPLPKPPEEVELMLELRAEVGRRSERPQAHAFPRVSPRRHRDWHDKRACTSTSWSDRRARAHGGRIGGAGRGRRDGVFHGDAAAGGIPSHPSASARSTSVGVLAHAGERQGKAAAARRDRASSASSQKKRDCTAGVGKAHVSPASPASRSRSTTFRPAPPATHR